MFIIFFIVKSHSHQYSMAIKLENNIKIEEELNKENSKQFPFIIKREKEQLTYKKGGDWSIQENAKYLAFLQANASAMQGKPHLQLWGLYKEMSEFLGTRNYRQCKNYHQKQCLKFDTISDIIYSILSVSPAIQSALEKERESYEDFREKSKRKEFGSLELEKQEKNDGIPTDIGYHQEEKIFEKKASSKMFTENSVLFPMMVNGFENMMEQKAEKQSPQAQDWIECHYLFMRYVNKLNEIQMRQWSM